MSDHATGYLNLGPEINSDGQYVDPPRSTNIDTGTSVGTNTGTSPFHLESHQPQPPPQIPQPVNIQGPPDLSNALYQGATTPTPAVRSNPELQDKLDVQVRVGEVLRDDIRRGATVHTFDPDASTHQKTLEAASGRIGDHPHLPSSPLTSSSANQTARPIAVIDESARSGELSSPTVDVDAIDRASRQEGQGVGGEVVERTKGGAGDDDGVDGGLGGKKSTVGWLESAGIPKPTHLVAGDPTSTTQRTPTSNYLTEKIPLEFYGTVYHNAGLIIFSILATRTITLLRLSWGWIIVLLAGCTTMYSLSIERTRMRARDDIQRELMKVKLVSETESADWINSLLDRAWLIAEPLLSATVVASVDEALKSAAFGPVESMKLTTFTLGNKSPRIDSIRTYPMTPDDEVIMEWSLSFTPNDLEDLTPRQARGKVNPKVVLSIKLGKGMVGGSIPVLLEDINFKGSMRIKLKLMSNFPHVQMVHMSFMEKPYFDYVLKPLGGDKFGMDINSIPGLAGFIKDQVHANLGPMMYDPNVFTINLEQLLSGTPLDSAIGILKVQVESAQGLKAVKLGGGAPDPYVMMGIGLKPAVNKTSIKNSTSHPVWNETQYILVNTLNDTLNLSVLDYNEHRSDNALGSTIFDLASLQENAEQAGIVSKIIQDGKDRGNLKYNISFYPVLKPTSSPDGTIEPAPESHTGIVRLTIHQAKDLDMSRTTGTLSPYAAVYLGSNQEIHRTPTMKASNAPVWESSIEFLVPDKDKSQVTIKLFDDRSLRDPALGTAVIRLEDLLAAKERQQDWFPLSSVRSGKIRITTDWKPLLIPGSIDGAAVYSPPIGIMRVWVKKAVELRNLELGLGGKSDPYVRVLCNHQIQARTEVVDNNLSPEWDEILYVPVHRANDKLVFEIMDHQNLTKDRHLGSVELDVADYIVTDGDNNETPYLSSGPKDKVDSVKIGSGQPDKGRLFYQASFISAVALRDGVKFDAVADTSALLSGKPIATGAETASIHERDTDTASLTEREEKPVPGVVMGIEDLLREQSGVLILQIIAGTMPKRGRLEVIVDADAYASFATEKARSHRNTWDQIGEIVVKELDFSQITLRMNENDPNEKPDVFAELTVQTKSLLESAFAGPTSYTLNVPNGAGMDKTMILLQARYVPLRMAIEMRESVQNMGILQVELIDAKGLHGSDRSGKSDPYISFSLNGEKVFKSQVKKKTLAPVWDERFETLIPSRWGSKLTFEVFDWNQVESAKSLGTGAIDLVSIEPFEGAELSLEVHTKEGVRGAVRVRVLFTPQLIARTRRNTGGLGRTLSRVGSTVGSAPIKVGKGVGHGLVAGGSGVAHGVGHIGGFAGRKVGLMKKKDKHGNEFIVEEPTSEVSPAMLSPARPAHGRELTSKASMTSLRTVSGRISVTCIKGRGIAGTASGDVKPYVVIQTDKNKHKTHHAKQSEEPQWNETFNIESSATNATLKVYDRKTIGKDKEIGEAQLELPGPEVGGPVDLWVELSNGRGQIQVRLDAGDSGQGNLARFETPNGKSGAAGSSASPGRFSFRRAG